MVLKITDAFKQGIDLEEIKTNTYMLVLKELESNYGFIANEYHLGIYYIPKEIKEKLSSGLYIEDPEDKKRLWTSLFGVKPINDGYYSYHLLGIENDKF